MVTPKMISKQSMLRQMETWWNGMKKFPNATSIHGFRYIADPTRHWIERIFWLFLVCGSWYASAQLISAQYRAYQDNPISFVVETTYKDWDTEFPAVAVCEHENTKLIEETSDKIWGPDHDFVMEDVLKEIVYFKGTTFYTSEYCGSTDPLPYCFKNLSHYARMIRSSCHEVLSNCSWNGVPFDCCTHFRPLETEVGMCYIINSIQTSVDDDRVKLQMINNKTTGPGRINVDVWVPANIYVLDEEEVPCLTTAGSDILNVNPEVSYKRLFTIKNVVNDYGTRHISLENRKCRFPDEGSLEVYDHYSYTACTVQCRANAQLKLCNCTNFLMPKVPEHLKCDADGVFCLNDNLNVLSVLKASWSSRPGLYCDCLQSCTEAEISIIKDLTVATGNNFSSVEIALAMLPSERYRRNVVRGILDLVVSTGGTCGLFLGISILSLVELIYIVLIRPCCDIYSRIDEDYWHNKFLHRNNKVRMPSTWK